MRRMFSKKQIERLVAENPAVVVEALQNQDVSINGLTSKGIANTGGLANIGNVAISGELLIIGDAKIFENITDSEGHKRFIEDNINIVETEGISKTYGKWSLSGTHLLIVLALQLSNELTLSDNQKLCDISLPEWVKSKLIPIVATTISFGSFTAYANDFTTQSCPVRLQKISKNISIYKNGSLTLSKDRQVRIEFDLLIDNESEE